jgi:hypothetical protein
MKGEISGAATREPIQMRSYSAMTLEARLLRSTFALIIAVILACQFYAAFYARGLHGDGAPLLVALYERQWFFLPSLGSRSVVEILRQTPIVLLSKYTHATLLQCGQVLSLVMLTLPTLLCWLCWFIAPREHRGWALFPLAALLTGFAATSFHAVGEAAIATGYFWVLLFLLLFRVRSAKAQSLFLLLCLPAFWLHEGTFVLTIVLLVALILRGHAAVGSRSEGPFAATAFLLLTAILVYQISRIIHPQFPGDRANAVQGLTHLEFLYADHRFNLPLVTGGLALPTLFAASFVQAKAPKEATARSAGGILAVWMLVTLAAIAAAIALDATVAPLAQTRARYHPAIVSAVLGAAMILLRRLEIPNRVWKSPTTMLVLMSLCAAQATADVIETRQWKTYIADLQATLVNERGLVPWETRLSVANRHAAIDWTIFEFRWTTPYMCIIFAPHGVVNTMIDLPRDLTFRPLDPELPDRLPSLNGIDYTAYRHFLAAQASVRRP